MRVVVVGAGLAGLRATGALRAGGADVELIEAGPRPGGRVRTVRDPFHAGQYAESGAEWVDSDHPRLLELLDRYGVGLQGEGTDWTTLRRMLFRGGVLHTPDEVVALAPDLDVELGRYEAILTGIASGIADPARPDLHPDAAVHDARSLADVAAEAGLGEVAALFARRASQGEFAEEPEAVSALFVAQQRALGVRTTDGIRSYRVDGGLGRVTTALASEVADVLSLGEALVAVDWSDSTVTVTTTSRTILTDRVVLACSLVPLRRVRFTPELPAALRAGVDELGYGTVTKTAVQYAARRWRPGFALSDLPAQRVYEPTVDQPGEPGVLMAYAGGDGGRTLAALDEAARIEAITADHRAIHGLTAEALAGFSRAWSAHARYGGSCAVYGPGQVGAHWQVLRQPCGPLWLAGEHVATWTGYMEGALESGDRVAAGILAGQ